MKTTFRMTVLLAGLMLLTGIGCEKIDWGFGEKDEAPKTARTTRSRAVEIGKRLAENEKLNPENYDIATREADEAWWVLFDHKMHGYKLGYPYHFAVHVTPDGKSTLMRDR